MGSYSDEAGHPDATDLTRDFSPGNSDAIDILTLGLGLGLGRVLGLELERQDVPGLKNTGVNFLASGRSRQDVADAIPKPNLKFLKPTVKFLELTYVNNSEAYSPIWLGRQHCFQHRKKCVLEFKFVYSTMSV